MNISYNLKNQTNKNIKNPKHYNNTKKSPKYKKKKKLLTKIIKNY